MQVDISSQHGYITIMEEGVETATSNASVSTVRISGTAWKVNTALRSVEYISAKDWHGWDRIDVVVADLGYDDFEATTVPQTYSLHTSVAAVNDAPVVEAVGLDTVYILDWESPSGDDIISAFLVTVLEDTAKVITGISISDVDTENAGVALNRPYGFSGTADSGGRGDIFGGLALHPKVKLSISCTYGLLSLSGAHGGLVVEEGDLDAEGKILTVIGTLSNVNTAMEDGILYAPQGDWSGIDVVKVSATWFVGSRRNCDLHIRQGWTS